MAQEPVSAGPSDQARRIAEYQACLQQIRDSIIRQWQALTVIVAIYGAAILIVLNVFPNDFYATWVKLSGGWIAFFGLTGTNGAYVFLTVHETFWQQVAFRRMLELEPRLGFDLATRGQRLMERARIRGRSSGSEYLLAGYQAGLYGVVPPLERPQYLPYVLWMVGLVQLLLFATAIVMTIFLLTHESGVAMLPPVWV